MDKVQQENAQAAKSLKLSEETYEGVHFRGISFPTPNKNLVPAVGPTLEVVWGVGDDKVMVAAGRDATKTLKTVLDQSKAGGKEVLPLRISLSGTPIAKFLAQSADNDQAKAVASALAKALKKSEGKDHSSSPPSRSRRASGCGWRWKMGC